MTTSLADKKCMACEGGVSPLDREEAREMLQKLEQGWEIAEGKKIRKSYEFDDFVGALDFTNKVGEIAEEAGHHPDIYLTYGEVVLEIWTHSVDGLTGNDFILAAKADRAREQM